jgi:hypothetical protein
MAGLHSKVCQVVAETVSKSTASTEQWRPSVASGRQWLAAVSGIWVVLYKTPSFGIYITFHAMQHLGYIE